jgi:hypothetical protein
LLPRTMDVLGQRYLFPTLRECLPIHHQADLNVVAS